MITAPSAAETARVVSSALDAHHGERGALLPVLHDIQDALGFVPAEHLDAIAAALGLSRAEVQGVVSFYHDVRTTPPGRHRVRLCRAEACRSLGSEALERELLARLGLTGPGTTADGRVTVDPVYCLGLCALSPAAQVDGQPVGRATVETLCRRLDAAEGR